MGFLQVDVSSSSVTSSQVDSINIAKQVTRYPYKITCQIKQSGHLPLVIKQKQLCNKVFTHLFIAQYYNNVYGKFITIVFSNSKPTDSLNNDTMDIGYKSHIR